RDRPDALRAGLSLRRGRRARDVHRDRREEAHPRRVRLRRARGQAAQEAMSGSERIPASPAASLSLRRRLALSGTATLVGVALVGTHESWVGTGVVLAGLVAMMHAIHTFGR